jgi:hypothetical protein
MVDLVTYQKMHKKVPEPKKGSEKTLSQKEMDAEEPPEGNFLLLLPRTVLAGLATIPEASIPYR